MYTPAEFKSMLFIDIETITQHPDLEDLKEFGSSHMYDLWLKKAENIRIFEQDKSELTDTELYAKCGMMYPEFGKIVTISIGQVKFDDIGIPITSSIKSFYGEDEKTMLFDFLQTMSAIFSKNPSVQIVGHNIKKFDMPWIVKRSLINGITPPRQFHFQKQKPWENCLLDTLEVWRFGGSNGASLDLICGVFDIPSPKDVMKGDQTSVEYWKGNLEKIKTYCEGDVLATMNVMLKISNLPIL